MVNLDKLRSALHEYRRKLVIGWSADTAYKGDGADGSPRNQCAVTSAWVQRRLRDDLSVEAEYCIGAVFNGRGLIDSRHRWLQVDDLVVDLTADQWDGEPKGPVVCDTHNDLVLRDWVYYEVSERLDAAQVLADPMQDRLVLLEERIGENQARQL